MSIQEKELVVLLQRYEEGTASEQERLFLEEWYEQLDVSEGEIWRSSVQEQATKDKLYGGVLHSMRRKKVRVIVFNAMRIAAAFLLAVTLVWLVRAPGKRLPAEIPGGVTHNSKTKTPPATATSSVHLVIARSDKMALKKVQLADGSTAWLNAGSILKYPDHFGDGSRMVEVTAGEVFFAVAKDHLHPFRVRAGSVTTTVLGTSFLVRQSFEKNTVEVSVKSGMVKVEKMNQYGASALVGRNLSPGDQLRYDTAANVYRLKKVAVDGIAAFMEGRLVYEDARLEEIVYDLGRKYGVSIHFGDDRLKEGHYRISFDNMPLQEALLILATLTSTHIEKEDKGRYIIK